MGGHRSRARALGRAARARARGRAARAPGDGARALPAAGRAAGDAAPRRARRAARRRGIDFLWSHQAEALESAWERTTITTTGTASGKSLGFQLPTLELLSRDSRARALFLYPVQGAGAGPGALAARVRAAAHAGGDLRRRHAARAARRPAPEGQRRADQPGHAARRDPAQPPGVGRTSSATSRSSWSTRRTSTAGSSARTWPTCCGGCGGSASCTGPRRASCWPRRRSPTRASWPRG